MLGIDIDPSTSRVIKHFNCLDSSKMNTIISLKYFIVMVIAKKIIEIKTKITIR